MDTMRHAVVCAIVLAIASYATAYSGGTGEPNDPYLISTPADWQMLCNTPADANGKCFLLTNSIYMLGNSAGDIGSSGQPFTGTFDGGGNWLTWLQYTSTNFYSGPFGWVGAGGVVKNLNLSAVSVSSTAPCGMYAGGLVGYNQGTIRNCSISGATLSPGYPSYTGGLVGGNNGLIVDCSFTGDLTINGGGYGGGLVGYNWGTILYSRADGNITANVGQAGGVLAGGNPGTIRNCCSTGSVHTYGGGCISTAGGLVGSNSGRIGSSFSAAEAHAHGTYKYDAWAGGLVGSNWLGALIYDSYASGSAHSYTAFYATSTAIAGGLVGYSGPTVSHSYSTGTATAGSAAIQYVGGLVGRPWSGASMAVDDCFWDVNLSGRATSPGGTGLTTAQMKTYSTFASAGWDFTDETANDANDIWRMSTGGGDYPRLAWQTASPGDFTGSAGVTAVDAGYLADRWLRASCPNAPWCDATDMDHSGLVDFRDFALFAQHWAGSL
jgi:hypothetical protein